MELEEFLEIDILHFLEYSINTKSGSDVDKEEDYGIFLNKNYILELDRSIDQDDLTAAQKLFDELKDYYNSLPRKSLEEKKVYKLLEQMYNKMDAYIKLKGSIKSVRSFAEILSGHYMFSDYLSPEMRPKPASSQDATIEKKLENLNTQITKFGEDVNEIKKKLVANPKSINDSMIIKVPKSVDAREETLKNMLEIKKQVDENTVKLKEKMPMIEKKTIVPIISPVNAENTINMLDKIAQSKSPGIIKGKNVGGAIYRLKKFNETEKRKKEDMIKKDDKFNNEHVKMASNVVVTVNTDERDSTSINSTDQNLTAINLKSKSGIEVEELYVDGLKRMYEKDYNSASEIFKHILELRPKNIKAMIRLKQCSEGDVFD